MSSLLIFLLGVLFYPLIRILFFVIHLFRVAIADTFFVMRYAELKEGYSKWNWVWIIPKTFYKSFKDVLFDELRGLHREL